MTAVAAQPFDALRSCPDGRYCDEHVVVTRARSGHPPIGITALRDADGRVEVTHDVDMWQLDDEIGTALAATLGGLTHDPVVFERAFTGIVLTSAPDAEPAWEQFYRNSLARIAHPTTPGYAEIYRHAQELLPVGGVTLDAGCSLGFLSLHLAARGDRPVAVDCDAGTTRMLRVMATRLGYGAAIDVVTADARAIPLPAASVDSVTLLHVLEHVDTATGEQLVAEAIRLARRRVVVAVPYESMPTALFGHVRSIDAGQLADLGWRSDWRYRVYEHHGGWLVLDRPYP